MALNNIVDKLHGLLTGDMPISNEPEVVYFLVEIGKILEKENLTDEYPLLKFYRDWSVHPRKDRSTEDVRTIVQAAYESAIAQIQSPFGMHHPVGVVDLAQGGEVKKEVEKFLQRYGLPVTLVDEEHWGRFVPLLAAVLSEQPLIPKGVDNVQWIEFLPANPGCVVLRTVFVKPVSDNQGKVYQYYDYLNYLG